MNKSAARPILITIAALIFCALPAYSGTVVQESVREAVSRSAASSSIDILISFENDLDPTAVEFSRRREKRDRAATYRDVMDRLTRNREELENRIQPQLKEMQADGRIESYKFFTVSKTVLVRTRVDNVENLAALPGVRLLNLNQTVSLINPVEERDADVYAKSTMANTALDAINIRSLWDRGLTGAGRLICSFDTGIDGDHPALASKWRGNNGGSSAESWFAPHGGTVPNDNIGHGSHVMGIMLGSAAADTFGVAPAAQWISAAVVDQGVSFSTTIADILSAFDWVLNPDGNINTTDDLPDVVCNSWGVPRGIFSDCDNTFWTAIDNVEAAGIVTIFAAGNEGPTARSMRNPADRASSPYNTLSVGAVDPLSLVVADFSSRGPASCDGVSIKPELVAPGVSIYSSYKDGGYKVMSGTSMATPFIAGLVTLLRQYNPEATVAEIKNALIKATVDLGPIGEDNSYGHGMIDASKILQYMPTPEIPQISVVNYHLYGGDDSYADPGETAELILTLNEPTAAVDSVNVWVSSQTSAVITVDDIIRYHFAPGTTYAVSMNPFYLQIAAEAVSGTQADLMVHFSFLNGLGEDSAALSINLGHPLPGQLLAVESGNISLTASDFGQFGFGEGSIYQAGGEGLRFGGSQNLLFEAGLIIGRNELMVSDAIRNDDGGFKESDFIPDDYGTSVATSLGDGIKVSYVDDGAVLPLPIKIEQEIYQSAQDFTVIEFNVINPTAERVDHLALGFFCDFEIDRPADRIGFDSLMGLLYHYNPEQNLYIGLIGVSANEFAYTAAQNGADGKAGFTTAEKYRMANSAGINIVETEPGDWYCMVSRTANQIEPFARFKMAVVLAVGESMEAMRAAAQAGMDEYNLYLDVDDEWAALPKTLELKQNYPNPFNPQTTIRFAVGSAQNAILTVYNVTGQKVRTLFEGMVQAGEQSVTWDGCDDNGAVVASGVYFYRLSAESETQSRKMVFLK